MRCYWSKGNPMSYSEWCRRSSSSSESCSRLLRHRLSTPPQSPRSITFFGRVEAVDSDRKLVIVKHGKIPGYMDSGTTEYSTEEEAVLKRLHPRDDIRAVVYPNDLTLYRIQIVYRPPGPK